MLIIQHCTRHSECKIGFGDLILLSRYFFRQQLSTDPNNNDKYFNLKNKVGFESVNILSDNKLKLNFWERREIRKPSYFSVKKIEYIKSSTCAKIPMIFSYSIFFDYVVSMEKVILELDKIILKIKTKNSSEEYILTFYKNKINLIRKDNLGAVDFGWAVGDYELC